MRRLCLSTKRLTGISLLAHYDCTINCDGMKGAKRCIRGSVVTGPDVGWHTPADESASRSPWSSPCKLQMLPLRDS